MDKQQDVQIEFEPMFSKERLDYFKSKGLSDEDIRTLEMAEAIRRSTELMPNDLERVFNKVESLPDDPIKAINELNEMGFKDTKSFIEIMATTQALDIIANTINEMAKENKKAKAKK